jgi:hypothetical protein
MGRASTLTVRKPFAIVALLLVVAGSTWFWWDSRGTSDVDLWLGWMREVLARGPRAGYVAIRADYPPGASLVLWMAGELATDMSADPRIVLKFILLGFLVGTTVMLLIASRRPALSAFAHAALVVNSFALMYLDILTAPFLLGAIWAGYAGRTPLMAALLAAACLMKWQPLLVLPFAAIYVIRLRGATTPAAWRRTAGLAAIAAAVVLLWMIPVYGFPAIWDALYRASRHNDLSNFGANPLWILTWWFERTASSGPTLSPEGIVVIHSASRPLLRALSLVTLVGYGLVLRAYWTSADRTMAGMVRYALAGYLVYFLCSAGVHENHLFLAVLLAIALAWLAPRYTWMAVVLAAALTINPVLFYGWQGGGALRTAHGIDDTVWFAIVVSVAVAWILWKLISRRADPGLTQV